MVAAPPDAAGGARAGERRGRRIEEDDDGVLVDPQNPGLLSCPWRNVAGSVSVVGAVTVSFTGASAVSAPTPYSLTAPDQNGSPLESVALGRPAIIALTSVVRS